ncbi:MAG: alpha/beta fold hydrolase, partial [Dehalococcoidales bacterium]|nr:alpha/beta fold hydrolase [Dehalococcoidales bacterium]
MAEKVTIEYQGMKLAVSYNTRPCGTSSLLLIHGLGSSKECFDDIWNYPDYRQYKVIIPDLPGFGESDKPRNFSYSMEDQAEILELLVYR